MTESGASRSELRGRARHATLAAARAGPNVDIISTEPLILAVDGLLSEVRTEQLKRILREQDMDSLVQTSAYVDDMFEEGRAVHEDAHFRRCVAKTGGGVPVEYQSDPLRSFLWVAATRSDDLTDADVNIARCAVLRRAWQRQWNSDDIARSGFRKAATRWRVPQDMLRCLGPIVVRVLGTGVQGIPGSEELCSTSGGHSSDMAWILRDSTVVRYRAGESQVPHLDTCDLTMLVYLSDTGGSTCFPNLGCRVPPATGRILLFFSTIPEDARFGGFADSAYGRPNDLTMHYGGLPVPEMEGDKLIVQLLLSVTEMGSASCWRDVLRGVAFQNGNFTSGRCALPLQQEAETGSHRPALALSQQRCASKCMDHALDLAIEPGGPKYCLHCWSSKLERMLQTSGAP